MKKLILVITFLLFSSTVHAMPILNTNNNHWYDHISFNADWFGANAHAQTLSHNGMAGHLVTLTSALENTWVVSNLSDITGWLGGFQPAGSTEPDGNWQWVTGEAWSYTNWAAGEPNNQGNENFLIFMNVSQWNDWSNNVISGYIIEYEGANPIPEPATIALLGIGLVGLAGVAVRRRIKKTKQK